MFITVVVAVFTAATKTTLSLQLAVTAASEQSLKPLTGVLWLRAKMLSNLASGFLPSELELDFAVTHSGVTQEQPTEVSRVP